MRSHRAIHLLIPTLIATLFGVGPLANACADEPPPRVV